MAKRVAWVEDMKTLIARNHMNLLQALSAHYVPEYVLILLGQPEQKKAQSSERHDPFALICRPSE